MVVRIVILEISNQSKSRLCNGNDLPIFGSSIVLACIARVRPRGSAGQVISVITSEIVNNLRVERLTVLVKATVVIAIVVRPVKVPIRRVRHNITNTQRKSYLPVHIILFVSGIDVLFHIVDFVPCRAGVLLWGAMRASGSHVGVAVATVLTSGSRHGRNTHRGA